MKRAIILAVITATVLGLDPRCLRKTNNSSPYLEHESDCQKYYVCLENKSVKELQCPSDLQFNPMLLKCDVPSGFCNRIHKRSEHFLVECNEKTHGTYIPVTGDCRKFSVCLNSAIVDHSCPDGQYFEAEKQSCMSNDDGQCESRDHQQKHNRDFISIDCYGKHGVFLADRNDCRRFYACIHGRKVMQYCQHGEFYDHLTHSCKIDYENECSANSGEVLVDDHDDHDTNNRDDHDYMHDNSHDHDKNSHNDQDKSSDNNSHDHDKNNHNAQDEDIHDNSHDHDKNNHTDQDHENNNHNEHNPEKNDFKDESTNEINCHGKQPGTFLSNQDDCTGYFVCSNGYAIPKQCPPSHFFDSLKLICTPNDGSCSTMDDMINTSADIPIYLSTTDAQTICTGKHGIIIPDLTDCQSFYLCVYGRAHHDRCYAGEYFDRDHRHCTKNHGECMSSITNNNILAGDSENNNFKSICYGYLDGTHLPHYTDCNKFFVCFDGIPIPEQCKRNEFFDNIHGFCRKNVAGSDGCSNTKIEKNVCHEKHGILIQHQEDCRKYYLCVSGQSLLHDCNANEYFNVKTGSCVLDIDLKCQKSIKGGASIIEQAIVKKEKVKVTKEPICSPGVNKLMFYPNVNDGCKSFYECVNGKPVTHTCPFGFIYNAVLNVCDVPDFVECTHTMNIKEIRDPSCTGAISGVRYSNFENGCKSFYVCSHGSAIQTFCGNGLLYNPILGVCDWVANVNCSVGNGWHSTF